MTTNNTNHHPDAGPLLPQLAGDEHWSVRLAVARHCAAGPLLAQLAEDEDWRVRAAVAEHPAAGPEAELPMLDEQTPRPGRTFIFEGCDDDVVEVEIIDGRNPRRDIAMGGQDSDPRRDYIIVGRFAGDTCPEGPAVHPVYTTTGCWTFGLGHVDEDTPMPAWYNEIRQHDRYSEILTLAFLPDDYELRGEGRWAEIGEE
jgi:hypothetical protein